MGIRNRATQSQIDSMFAVRLDRIETAIISRLMYIGETFVNNAKANGTYNDVTGNLRGSICYVVIKNGKKKSPGDIPANSKKRMRELMAQFNKGYVLIVLAGMDYASAVESKGKDVLTASSIIARAQLKTAITNFKRSLKNS
jgi:uncharacterized protein YycO